MNTNELLIIPMKPLQLDPDIRFDTLLGYSFFQANCDTLQRCKDEIISNPSIEVFGCFDDKLLVGLVVVNIAETLEIINIGTCAQKRGCGIGKKMIEYIRHLYPLKIIHAETDDDAVGFYRKCGFVIHDLGEKYPGVRRYVCRNA